MRALSWEPPIDPPVPFDPPLTSLPLIHTLAQSERNAIRKELIALDAARERLKEQSSAMKSKLKFYTLEAVDKEVARLEETLAHTTMSLNEEKKLVTTIKDLGKSRDAVRQYAEAQAKASGDDGARRAIIERLRAKDAEIDAVKAEQGVVRAALDATRSKEEKAGADIPKMQEERNACYEVIKAKREKIRALRADFKKTQDEYWERERLWRSFLTAEKQKQWEATVEERKARDEARKQWERENAPEPFEAEVTAADQLVAYLARWDPSSRVAEEEDAKKKAEEAREKAAAALSGLTLLGKKNNNDAEDDDLFSLSGSSSGKKSKLKAKAKAKVKTAEGGSFDPSERLHVSFDAYGSFAKLALAAPTTAGEVPATLEALRAKKAEFLEKRRVKKERIAAGLEDEEEDRAAKEAKEAGGRARGSRGKAGAKGGKGRKTRGKKGKALVDVTIEVVEDAVKVTIEEIGEDVEE